MKGSAFLAAYKGKPYTAWEAAAVDLARQGSIVGWPLLPLTLTAGAHTCTVRVAADVLTVGEPDDDLRLPLTPAAAQRIADALDMLLPTTKIATAIGLGAPVRLTPKGMAPNLGASLQQYADHDAAIDADLAALGTPKGIVTGQKKDVVIGKLVRPGKVVIFGWFWPDQTTVHGPYMTANLRASNPIQPYSDAHGDFYVDYSHGIRLVEGTCLVDGQRMRTDAVLADPELAALLSDEGPLAPSQIRYPTGTRSTGPAVPYPMLPTERRNAADRGLDVVRSETFRGGTS